MVASEVNVGSPAEVAAAGRERDRDRLRAGRVRALLGVAAISVAAAGAGGVSGALAISTLLFLVIALATAVVIRWGARLQAAAVGIVVVAYLSSVYLATGGLSEAGGFQGVALLVGCCAAIWIAGELERTRMRAEVAEQTREDFVVMLVHDIKAPLATIESYVDLLLEGREASPADRREILTQIGSAARRATMLATNLLDVEKIDTGRMTVVRRPTRLREALEHSFYHHRRFAEANGVKLEVEDEESLPDVEVDPVLIDRVFANLLNNAIKYTPKGGAVRVTARRTAAELVEIVFEDTGRGISPEVMHRLFQKYAQGSPTNESTGLGLFIAKTIAEAHGGAISAENRPDRPGARFRISLPALRKGEIPAKPGA